MYINPYKHRRNEKGFSFTEIIVASVILFISLSVLSAVIFILLDVDYVEKDLLKSDLYSLTEDIKTEFRENLIDTIVIKDGDLILVTLDNEEIIYKKEIFFMSKFKNGIFEKSIKVDLGQFDLEGNALVWLDETEKILIKHLDTEIKIIDETTDNIKLENSVVTN